jgi:hypothetical protein
MALLRLKAELEELEEDEDSDATRVAELRAEINKLQREEAVALGSAMAKKKSSSSLSESSGSMMAGSSGRVIQLSPRVAVSSSWRVGGSESPRDTGAGSPRGLASSPPRARIASPRSPQSESPRSEASSMGKRVLERHVATLNKLFATPGQVSAKRQEVEAFSEAVALHDKDGTFREMMNQFFNRLAEEKNAK